MSIIMEIFTGMNINPPNGIYSEHTHNGMAHTSKVWYQVVTFPSNPLAITLNTSM